MQKRDATDVFSEWASNNKDEGMQRGHAASVEVMLSLVEPYLKPKYSAIDVGCGNGWVCRKYLLPPQTFSSFQATFETRAR